MRKLTLLSILLIPGLMLIAGCGQETDLPTAPAALERGTVTYVPDAFAAAMNPDGSSASYGVYLPPGYDENRTAGYPVLYLLHGFGGNEHYFTVLFNTPLVADKLLAAGRIDPMIIVFPSGKNMLGGSFYTDSPDHPAVNNSEQHILGIIAEVDANYNTITDATGRAIGGTSMGAFGAMSIAMNNPGLFSSISSLAGPLSFLGGQLTPGDPSDDGYTGISMILPTVLAETGYDAVLAENPAGDATQYRAMMYPTAARRVTSFMFAMAAAFSPTPDPTNPGPTTILALPNGTPIGVDLPIDIDGSVYAPVFMNRWLQFDPVSRLAAQAVNIAPPGVKTYLDAGEHDDLGMNFSHAFFAGAYQLAFGIGPTVNNSNGHQINDAYPGYGDLPNIGGGVILANHTAQNFARLEPLLRFHSDNF